METEKKRAVRSAEKARKSTCSFADRIAALSIEAFKHRCPPDLQNSFQQTVLASILVENTVTSALRVVSIGVGTKFMSTFHCDENGKAAAKHLFCVRDCHAEVLARRAFLLYIYKEIECLIEDRLHGKVMPRRPDTSVLQWRYAAASACESISTPFQVRDCIRIHLYTSSMPCGNACLKRWAKGRAVVTLPLSSWEYPTADHARLHVTAADQGQVSLLVKRGSGTQNCTCCRRGMHDTEGPSRTGKRRLDDLSGEQVDLGDRFPLSTEAAVEVGDLDGENSLHDGDLRVRGLYFPPGTYPLEACPSGARGRVMTCSDKIAMWSVMGIQGALLSHLVHSPVYLTSITIGRKFSDPHARRALCCRLQDFSSTPQTQLAASHTMSMLSDNNPARTSVEGSKEVVPSSFFSCHHPVLMCTAVKLDEKVIHTSPYNAHETEAKTYSYDAINCAVDRHNSDLVKSDSVAVGACFNEKRCLFWSGHPGGSDGPAGLSGRDVTVDKGSGQDSHAASGLDLATIIDGETGLLWKPNITESDESEGNEDMFQTAAVICSASLLARYRTCVESLCLLAASKTKERDHGAIPSMRGSMEDTLLQAAHNLSVNEYITTKRSKFMRSGDSCAFSLAKEELLTRRRKGDGFGRWIRTTSTAS